MRRRPGALFAPGLSLWIFSRDILFRLYRKVSYPSFTPHQAQGTYAIRQESEKRAGEYRENGAREDRDPLQDGTTTRSSQGDIKAHFEGLVIANVTKLIG